MKDSGHHWMRQCDSCGGWHHCPAPQDPDAEPSWMCDACKDAEDVRSELELMTEDCPDGTCRACCKCYDAVEKRLQFVRSERDEYAKLKASLQRQVGA